MILPVPGHGLRTPIHSFPVDSDNWLCQHVSLGVGNIPLTSPDEGERDGAMDFNQLYMKVYDKGRLF